MEFPGLYGIYRLALSQSNFLRPSLYELVKDIDCGKTSLISKILFQLGEMMKTSQYQVKHSYNSNMSTILKLSLALFDMGGMRASKNVFDHSAQTLRRRKLKLCDF